MNQPQFIVAQLGARMHYAVPRILATNAMLDHFYTDFSAGRGWPKLLRLVPQSVRPKALQRLLGRVAQGVPPQKTTAFNFLGLRYARRLRRNHTAAEHTATFLWVGRQFCRQVRARGFNRATAVYTFNTAGLEILQAARRYGLLAVMEQTIAPKRIEVELLETERARFAGWEPDGGQDAVALELADREAAEWDASHLILCASEFVLDGIAKCGGPVEKCVVVPYGVDVPVPKPEAQERKPGRPLRVLTVGTVGLRKGSPYILEAARQLKGSVVVRMVGGIGVTPETEANLREYLELAGPVPRSRIAEHFAWADVFLLPSLCEGSATVTYEALAHGLPVICTPNTGSVVRDNMDGFIVPARDVNAIVDRLKTLLAQPELRLGLSANARARAAEFTVSAYGNRLFAALNGAKACQEKITA